MASVEMTGIRKEFGDVVVIPGADLKIEDSEFVVFVGPSGCGKSTLLRLLAGLEDPSGGSIAIDGNRIDHLAPAKRGFSMVFQTYALYPHMTVFQNMSYSLRVAGAPKEEIARKVTEAAEILQLTDYLHRKPRDLSGGQRQRVAIGRAIVRDPKVFLFDEPLSNLDAKLRVQMRIEISKLHRRLNATMIYVTHDQVEAMTMADKIVVLNKGRIEQVGAPLELYNRPANLFVAGFIGSPAMNFFDGTIAGVGATGLDVELEDGSRLHYPCATPGGSAVGDAVKLGIRPEHFTLDDPADGKVAGTVDTAERLGGETYLYMTSTTGHEVVVHASGDKDVTPGDRIDVGYCLSDAHLFAPDGQRIAPGAP